VALLFSLCVIVTGECTAIATFFAALPGTVQCTEKPPPRNVLLLITVVVHAILVDEIETSRRGESGIGRDLEGRRLERL
jgi:hypothetical protein